MEEVSKVVTFLWSSPPLSCPRLSALSCRSSQLLYSTYLLTSAERAIDVDEELRREVYGQLTPPFEELFDGVEEHALSILLEPWTLLVSRDRETFQKVTRAHPQFDPTHSHLEEGFP